MKNPIFVATSLLALSLLANTSAGAVENPPRDHQQQLAQNMSAEERATLREQLGTRMRETSPADQTLMRDSAYNGKQRMENSEDSRTEQRSDRNEGYGRGHESRQGGDGGMRGSGMGGGKGGGRGR